MTRTDFESSEPLTPVVFEDLAGPRPHDHFHVGMVGDLLLTDALLQEAAVASPGELRESLWHTLARCSLVIANLEAPITDRDVPVSNKQYNLRTSRRVLDVFDSRFVLSLANNHIMDFGPQGLGDTIFALEGAGIAYTGAGRDLDHARVPHYVEVDGVKVAVIAAADPRFQPATASTPGTNPAIAHLLVESVTEARHQARLVAVTIHMGLEYAHFPSSNQIHLAERCLAAGAQIVQFHHSHCLSGCSSNGSGVVLFGTGNYAFPTVTDFDVPKARYTAAWIARYSKHAASIVALGMAPALLDRIGLPRALSGPAADEQVQRVQKTSDRMLAPVRRQFWRMCDLLHPSFMIPTLRNYQAMVRNQGVLDVCRSVIAGLKSQLTR